MAYEKEFHVRVNRGIDNDEVILRAVDSADTLVTHPEGDERGYFKDGGRAKGTFTMIQGSVPKPEDEAPAESATKGKK